MFTEGRRVAFLDFDQFLVIDFKAELTHEHEGFFRTDDFNIRIAENDFFHAGAVVRFHMVDDHVIEVAAVENVFYVF